MKWIWTVLAVAAVAAAAAPNVEAAGLREELRPEQRAQVVREAYAKLAHRVAAGGEQVSFEVSDVRTLDRRELRFVSWLDLVTMPGGEMVDMTREVRRHDGVTQAVVYRPEWSAGESGYLETPEGRRLIGMAADDVVAEIARERPAIQRLTAVTTYQVTVRLAERHRTYRAALLWLKSNRGGRTSVIFMDHVTQGLEEAVRERPVAAAPRPLQAITASSTTCNVSSKSQTLSDHQEAFDGHFSGSHWSSASVQFTCNCKSDCSATCQPNFLYSECEESGSHWDSCHQMASSISSEIGSSGDGIASPPGCAAGWGCVKKSCLYCTCGLEVSVSIIGLNVSFSFSGDPDWTGNMGFNHQCAACTEYVEPPTSGGGGGGPFYPRYDDPNTGGGGGGGGSGGCCTWNTSCYVDANGVYTCTPSTCRIWGC